MNAYDSLASLAAAHKQNGRIRYDCDLLEALNNWYADRRPAPAPRPSVEEYAQSRVNLLFRACPTLLRSQPRCLEIGCGNGALALALAREIKGEIIAVDLRDNEMWSQAPANLDFRIFDISREDPVSFGAFDFVYSLVAWEHIEHPLAALAGVYQALRPGGVFYLRTNLYRGPLGSHWYRWLFFPWPNLLFDEETVREHYGLKYPGSEFQGPWVNSLVADQYEGHWRRLGFSALNVQFDQKPIDEDLYQVFEEKLGKYPRFDLATDFLNATLVKPLA